MRLLKFFILLSPFFLQPFYSIGQLSCAGRTTVNFSFTGGVQTWTVPANVFSIRIKTRGATGGGATSAGNNSGGGAVIEGEYTVSAGQVLTILVGGRGTNGDNEAGGGGSTGVYIGSTLYIVAGGGGGEDNTGSGGNGLAAANGSNGGNDAVGTAPGCTGVGNGQGGSGGNAGNHGEPCAGFPHGGGGGGGLNGAGASPAGTNSGGGGRQGSISGGAGGTASTDDGGVAGGWGWSGGGGADDRESGGGGGYSGGGGGPEGGFPGGGGSFLASGFLSSFTANGTATTTIADGTVQICYVTAPLPVVLTSFSATRNNNQNLLRWTTVQEQELKAFIVEKSTDGRSFKAIGEVTPLNLANGSSYQFIDLETSTAKQIYRLKITENNGTTKFSDYAILSGNDNPVAISIYPNPATDFITITSALKISKAEIIAADGTIVMTKYNINTTERFSLNGIATGIYTIRFFTPERILTTKVIKY
jgi:hypothetical protein